jgi:hypothetical protein
LINYNTYLLDDLLKFLSYYELTLLHDIP